MLAAIGGVLARPEAASACAFCFSATPATRNAYYGTTALLLVLPFALAAGLFFGLRRFARAERSPAAATPRPSRSS